MPCTHYLPVGITSYGLLRFLVSSEDSSDVSSTAACAGKWCCLFARAVCLIWICFNFTGQPRTVQEYVRVGVQGPSYLGFRPADDLSVEFERWAMKCRIASVERSLTRFPPPWRSVRVA